VRVDTITLPEVSESIGGVPDTADLYAPYLSKALRAQYKNKLPIVVVLQGANVDKEQYSILGQRLARLGMIAVIPNSFRTFPFLGNVLFSDVQVLPRALAAVAEEAADKNSPIRGTPDFDAIGVVGHSLGGSAALYAAAEVCIGGLCEGCPNPAFGEQGQLCPELFTRPDGLKAVALYGTNLALPTPPGGVIPLPYDGGIPIAFLSGTLDSVSTPQETLDTYLSVVPPSGSPPTLRSLVSIVGTNHFGILKENNPEGAQPDLSEPDLPQLYGARLIAQTIAVWLRWHLQQDPLAEHWYTNVGASLDGTVVVDDLQ
jgi:predicted dienelactone hydrolase